MRNGIILALISCGLLFSGFFVVDQRQVAIISPASAQSIVYTPGLHWQLALNTKLTYVYTNLRTSQLALTIASENPNIAPLKLNLVINLQVVKPLAYLLYRQQSNLAKAQLEQSFTNLLLPKLVAIAATSQNLSGFMRQVNQQLQNIEYAAIGIELKQLRVMGIDVVNNHQANLTNSDSVVNSESLTTSYNLAQQIQTTANNQQQQELAKLRQLDAKFFDYFLQIKHYQQNATPRDQIPKLTSLFALES